MTKNELKGWLIIIIIFIIIILCIIVFVYISSFLNVAVEKHSVVASAKYTILYKDVDFGYHHYSEPKMFCILKKINSDSLFVWLQAGENKLSFFKRQIGDTVTLNRSDIWGISKN